MTTPAILFPLVSNKKKKDEIIRLYNRVLKKGYPN